LKKQLCLIYRRTNKKVAQTKWHLPWSKTKGLGGRLMRNIRAIEGYVNIMVALTNRKIFLMISHNMQR